MPKKWSRRWSCWWEAVCYRCVWAWYEHLWLKAEFQFWYSLFSLIHKVVMMDRLFVRAVKFTIRKQIHGLPLRVSSHLNFKSIIKLFGFFKNFNPIWEIVLDFFFIRFRYVVSSPKCRCYLPWWAIVRSWWRWRFSQSIKCWSEYSFLLHQTQHSFSWVASFSFFRFVSGVRDKDKYVAHFECEHGYWPQLCGRVYHW